MLLDQFGRTIEPMEESSFSSGWVVTGGVNQVPYLPKNADALLRSLKRDAVQKACRLAYYTNPLFYGAVEVITSFVLGTGVVYGELNDGRAQATMEEFWATNGLDTLIERFFVEFLLDGEALTTWPLDQVGNQPAYIGMWDVAVDAPTVTPREGLPHIVDRVEVQKKTYTEGQFVWSAYGALYNDVRGYPSTARAVLPALAYMNLIDFRMRAQELQGRINGIYYAFASNSTELDTKAKRFTNIPRHGTILTLAKDKASGNSEQLEFAGKQGTAAGDGEKDARLIRLLLAVALQLPEHYLGEGGGVTRTTADSMGAPAIKGLQRKQQWVYRWITSILRTELKRRNGKDRTYTVKRTKLLPGGDKSITGKRVRADLLDFPLIFPSLQDEDLGNLIQKVQVAASLRLASTATLSGELGYDYATEVDALSTQNPPDPTAPDSPPT